MDIDRYLRRKLKTSCNGIYPYICVRGGRQRLAEVFNELGYKIGVEIGTRKGDYSRFLCETIPGLNLTCIDPWMAYTRVSQQQQDEFYKQTMESLSKFNVKLIRKTSLEAVRDFKDRSIDFVFIDGSHAFDDICCDLIFWSKKVKLEGIVSGHDYSMFPDVIRAVHAYVEAHSIAPWYILREYESSFFWVNRR